MDYDPQASSLTWLRSRAPQAPRIHAANGAPEKFGRLRSFEMYVPPETRQLIIDAPAGASGLLLHEMLERAHCVARPGGALGDRPSRHRVLHQGPAFQCPRCAWATCASASSRTRCAPSMPAYTAAAALSRIARAEAADAPARLGHVPASRGKRHRHLRDGRRADRGRAPAIHADRRVGGRGPGASPRRPEQQRTRSRSCVG